MKRSLIISALLAAAAFSALSSPDACAQFKKEAFTQSYNSDADSLATADTTDKLLDFKEIFGGLAGKRKMRIGTMFGTGLVIPGTAQIYEKNYWKLPIFYGGIAAGITGGIICNSRYKATGEKGYQTASILSFVGAGLFHYASLMDGVICYRGDREPYPGRSTIFSILCPGLGQAYNGEFWKIPIYLGGIVGSLHFLSTNGTNYIRYRDIYRAASEPGYSGPINATQAKYYRDEYRRFRDYSIVALGLFYLLQVIDANVFAYMTDFEVSDNVQASIGPAMIMPENYSYAMRPSAPAAGMTFAFRF